MTAGNMKFLSGFMKFWTLFIGTGALVGAPMMWTTQNGNICLPETLTALLAIIRNKSKYL